MLFTAKCYWPGVSESELRTAVAGTVGDARSRPGAIFRGALYLPADELVLCLFEAPAKAAVKEASELAGLPCERVIDTVWLAPPRHGVDHPRASEGGLQ